MKFKWMPVAALVVAALTVPALAQEEGKDTESARTINLTEKHEKGRKITESSSESNHTKVETTGMVVQQEWSSQEITKVTEILEVNDAGKIVKARLSWSDGTDTVEAEQMGMPGEPMEMESELNGASILYTWNAETEEYDSKLEKGDEALEDVSSQLDKAHPFANPFVPGREVKLGETWDCDEGELKRMFGNNEGIKLTEITGTCTAEEITKEEDVEFLTVAFKVEMKGELQDDNIGKPELTATITGTYQWNIAESRIESVEMENEGSFDAETDNPADPAGAKIPLTITITGEQTMEMAYGKVGEDDAEDDDDTEDDGGMDG